MSSLSQLLLSALLPVLLVPSHNLTAQAAQQEAKLNAPATDSLWSSDDATHAFGFPEAKANKKGLLELDVESLTFTTKTVNASILRSSITAVSVGNDRVELWGTGGMLLRMAIPKAAD